MVSREVDQVWQFEDEWVKDHGRDKPILYRDFFHRFVLPYISQTPNRTDWDNNSGDWTFASNMDNLADQTDADKKNMQGQGAQGAHASADACRAACDVRGECLQFAWEPGKCRLSKTPRLGKPVKEEDRDKGRVSGWMVTRIEDYGSALEPCSERDIWILE